MASGCGPRQANDTFLPALANAVEHHPPIDALRAICNFAYLVQSSYLTAFDVRGRVISPVISTCGRTGRDLLDIAEAGQLISGFSGAVLAVAVVQIFKIYYMARFLLRLYTRVLDSLPDFPESFEERLGLLVLASILAESGDPGALDRVYDDIALRYQIQLQLESGEVDNHHR